MEDFIKKIPKLLATGCGHDVLAKYIESYEDTEYVSSFFDKLFEVLHSGNVKQRAAVSWVLSKITSPPDHLIKELVELLNSKFPIIQEAAIFALAKQGKERIQSAGYLEKLILRLNELFRTGDSRVKQKAAEALHTFGELELAEPVITSDYVEGLIEKIKEGYVTLMDSDGKEIRSRDKILDIVKLTNIFIGIPSYKEGKKITRPAKQSYLGAKQYLDNGSVNVLIVNLGHLVTGNTKAPFIKLATEIGKSKNIRFMFISTGLDDAGNQILGKGNNLRNLFELIAIAGSQAIGAAIVDADLKSITKNWIRELLAPVVWNNPLMTDFRERTIEAWEDELLNKIEIQSKKLKYKYSWAIEDEERVERVQERLLKIETEKRILEMEYLAGADFVAPWYSRSRYDGTITNSLVMPFVALLGVKIRQPIGGDCGFSPRAVHCWLMRDWTDSTYQYGIDNFMTSSCIIDGLNITETILGAKVHAPSAPKLDQMFVEVAYTLFTTILQYKEFWGKQEKLKDLSSFRLKNLPYDPPQRLKVDYEKMKKSFVNPFRNESSKKSKCKKNIELLEEVLEPKTFKKIIKMIDTEKTKINNELWKDVVFDFLAYFSKVDTRKKKRVINLFKYIYMGRAASFYYQIELSKSKDSVPTWKKKGLSEQQIERKAHLKAEKTCDNLAKLFHSTRNELIEKLEM